MKDDHVRSFWIGFLISVAAAAALYWLLQQKRADQASASALAAAGDGADPLEIIHGIGPVYAGRLQRAGIRTFADLAQASAERIDEILGRHQPQAPDWIAEAKSLAA
jgi:predicted flap endonuclease-1-like 5' DNA nuclease